MKAIWHIWGTVFGAILVPILKQKLGIETVHVHGVHGVLATAAAAFAALHIADMKVGDLVAKAKTLEAQLAGLSKPAAAVLFAALALGLGGCAGYSKLSDADLAATIKAQAAADVSASLVLASSVDQAKALEIKTDAIAVKAVLDGPIAQLFAGAGAGTVTLSAYTSAMPLLKSKLAGIRNGPAIAAAIQLALTQILGQLQLPGVPSAFLDTRITGAVIAFFQGASKGIGDFAGGQ